MKTRLSACVAVVLILTVLSYPLNGFAGEADTFKWKAATIGASASFSSVDEAGIQTNVYIFTSDWMEHSAPGAVRFTTGLEAHIERFDSSCPYWVEGCPSYLMRARTHFPVIEAKDFRAPAVSNGARASLNTTVDAFEYVSGSTIELSVDLTWVCIGEVGRNRHSHSMILPGLSVDVASNNSTFCSAQASGTISDGVTNFTPEPSLEAGIFEGSTVEVEISIAP